MSNHDTDGRGATRRFIHGPDEAPFAFHLVLSRKRLAPNALMQFGATRCTVKAQGCVAHATGCKKQVACAPRLGTSTGKLLHVGGVILTLREKRNGVYLGISARYPRVLPLQAAVGEV